MEDADIMVSMGFMESVFGIIAGIFSLMFGKFEWILGGWVPIG
mgnify:FL=1|jgi:hypothetical protein